MLNFDAQISSAITTTTTATLPCTSQNLFFDPSLSATYAPINTFASSRALAQGGITYSFDTVAVDNLCLLSYDNNQLCFQTQFSMVTNVNNCDIFASNADYSMIGGTLGLSYSQMAPDYGFFYSNSTMNKVFSLSLYPNPEDVSWSTLA